PRRSRAPGPQLQIVLQDPGRRAPDRLALIVEEVHGARPAGALPRLDAEAPVLQQRGQRDLDHLLDFLTVRPPRRRIADEAHERRDHELRRHGFRIVERAQRLDRLRSQADLFLAFTKRGGEQRRVVRSHDASGKRDLALVVADPLAALGEEQPRLAAVDDRYQHGRSYQRARWNLATGTAVQARPGERDQLVEGHRRDVTGP